MSAAGEPQRGTVVRCGAAVYRSTDQSITAGGSGAFITFDTEIYNSVGMWISSAPTKITILVAGYYICSGNLRWEASATGSQLLQAVYLNGTTYVALEQHPPHATAHTQTSCTAMAFLKVGDYLELLAFNNANVAVIASAVATPAAASLSVHRVSS